MAHIVFISYFFTPDSLSTAVLMAELAQDLKEKYGHQITVITTTPHYNLESEMLARQPLGRLWGSWLQQSELSGIRVLHVQVAPKGSRIWSRAFDYLRYHGIGTLAGLFLVEKPDLFFVPSPPLTIGVQAWLLSLWQKAPFLYNVQEIYPDVAISLGILRNSAMIYAMKQLERFIYDRSHHITIISEWFRRALMAKGIATDKLSVIPNFVDTEFVQPQNRLNQFSNRHELDDKFVVLYAGNIGLTQSFETILEAAQCLNHLSDLHFVIVGGGTRRAWLETELVRRNAINVTLLTYQPRSIVPLIYASSDVCLVPLKRNTAQDTFPSKIYTIMAAGRAVLASADPDSELSWVVEQAECGWSILPDNAGKMKETLEYAYYHRSELADKGQRGRAYVVSHHSRQTVVEQYHGLITNILG